MDKPYIKKIYKIYAFSLFIIFFLRYMLGGNLIEGRIFTEMENPVSALFAMFCIWMVILAVLIFLFNAFYDLKILKALMYFFVMPVAAINLIFIGNTLDYMVGETIGLRGALTIAEAIMLAAGVIAYAVFYRPPKMSFKYLGAVYLGLFAMLLYAMPVYAPLYIFGIGTAYKKIYFAFFHRVFLYVGFLTPLIAYFAFHKKDAKFKEFVILFIGISTLITFLNNYRFPEYVNLRSWPLHLCHTAMYLVPICIIFKLKKFFYFTYFVNVLGAFIAMLFPSTVEYSYLWEPSIMLFFVNHWTAFYLPILAIALGVYERPKWPEFKLAMIGFSAYFFTILFIDMWFSNYNPDVDYFFLNTDYIAGNLGKWCEDLRLITVTFHIGDLNFTMYPAYQIPYYIAYIIISFGIWFLYENCYQVADNLKALHAARVKIKLDRLAFESSLNGRSMSEPVNPEGADMIVIRNFCKKYGNSDTFAVKDANLEIKTGEIFGFLGPNGAGKSTIIKSIVGIQPLTSGSIEICGYDIEKQSVEAKMQIGFVPDHYALYENLTGREYINYIADLYEVSQKDRDERIEHFVSVFELTASFDNKMKTYSHGMKQKIAIMAALVHNPKVWILDEPLTGLDPTSIFQVKEAMKSHAKAGNIVFFSSHIIDVVEKICDKIAIIKKGTIMVNKTIKEIEASGGKLEQLYMETIGEKPKDGANGNPVSQAART